MKRNWRRTLGQHLRHMTTEQIRASLLRIRVRAGMRIDDQPEVRKLTGGYNGQTINPYVIRKLNERHRALRDVARVREFDPTEQAD